MCNSKALLAKMLRPGLEEWTKVFATTRHSEFLLNTSLECATSLPIGEQQTLGPAILNSLIFSDIIIKQHWKQQKVVSTDTAPYKADHEKPTLNRNNLNTKADLNTWWVCSSEQSVKKPLNNQEQNNMFRVSECTF